MADEKKPVEFLGFEVKETKDGFKMPASSYQKYLKEEENITPETLEAISNANKKLLKKGLEFCSEQVVTNGGHCRLTIQTEPGSSLYAQVHERDENKGGIKATEGDGVKYGACRLGMKIKVSTAFFEETRDKIASDCKAAYDKRNK